MIDDPLVTFEDIRELNYCVHSVTKFCQDYKIDIRRFRKGVPASELRATGFHFAIKAAEHAEAKHGRRG